MLKLKMKFTDFVKLKIGLKMQKKTFMSKKIDLKFKTNLNGVN